MQTVLIVIHLIIVVAMVCLILLQRSEGGALGIGGGGGFMSQRSATNLLTRMTTFLALGFFITSISLTLLARQQSGSSLPDAIGQNTDPTTTQQSDGSDLQGLLPGQDDADAPAETSGQGGILDTLKQLEDNQPN